MKKIIDVRSDTVTIPTKEMREVMMHAKVGDDILRDDPTVIRLEALAANMLGKEDAIFTVSGTMSNEIAVMVYSKPGDEIIVLPESHIYNLETGALAALSGTQARPVESNNGIYNSEKLNKQLSQYGVQRAKIKLICLENAFNLDRGLAIKRNAYENIIEIAKNYSIPIFMDGARLFNASVALGEDVHTMVDFCDSVAICFSKGLSAPFGSILAGRHKFIEEARRMKQRLGGGMRQAGILAAPAIMGLTKMINRLQNDHDKASMLRNNLNNLGLTIDQEGIQTNIVNVDFSTKKLPAKEVAERLLSNNIKVKICTNYNIRIVVHKDVCKDDIFFITESIDHILKTKN